MSTRSASMLNGQFASASPLLTSAILPAVALMLIDAEPSMFGVGSVAPGAPPEASWMRKYSPGPMTPPIGWKPVQLPVLAAAWYCSVQPVMSTGLAVGLYSSM